MPEAPDLEVIKEYLNRNATGRTIASAEVLRPSVVRSMTGEDLERSLPEICPSMSSQGWANSCTFACLVIECSL